jgi:cold-inducible RNA-binding protein
MSSSTLYVSNLPFSATEDELLMKFEKCGAVVSAKIVLDADSGRSKGFGFIEMASSAEALAAIRRLNLTTYDGRPMSVNFAPSADKANLPA